MLIGFNNGYSRVSKFLTILVALAALGEAVVVVAEDDDGGEVSVGDHQRQPETLSRFRRSIVVTPLGKRLTKSLVEQFGKRPKDMYSFGIGKRSISTQDLAEYLEEEKEKHGASAPYGSEDSLRHVFSSGKRDPYAFGLGKRDPYAFGLGKKRSDPYAFGLGKRRAGEEEEEEEEEQQRIFAPDLALDSANKKHDPYAFGLGKRDPYAFGLGKKSDGSYAFGLGKRDPYAFGLGKKRDPYAFGLGKKKRDPYAFGLGRKRDPYAFGLGKRDPYGFGLGKRLAA